MIKGCREWQANGLSEPDSVREATTDYRSEMDPIGDFVDERCERGTHLRARTRNLWTDYQKWCDEKEVPTEGRIENETQFGTLLTQRGIVAKKTRGVMVRYQIALKPSDELEPAQAGSDTGPDARQAFAPRDESGPPAEQEPATVASESNGQTIEPVVAETEVPSATENPSDEGDEYPDEYPDEPPDGDGDE
jgi:phage/plasmid-associated DNA primase